MPTALLPTAQQHGAPTSRGSRGRAAYDPISQAGPSAFDVMCSEKLVRFMAGACPQESNEEQLKARVLNAFKEKRHMARQRYQIRRLQARAAPRCTHLAPAGRPPTRSTAVRVQARRLRTGPAATSIVEAPCPTLRLDPSRAKRMPNHSGPRQGPGPAPP